MYGPTVVRVVMMKKKDPVPPIRNQGLILIQNNMSEKSIHQHFLIGK